MSEIGKDWVANLPMSNAIKDWREGVMQGKPVPENYDPVNHPPHYAMGRKYETIDVIDDWFFGNYYLGQVCKYISRAGRKGGMHDELKDLDKAAWYLARYRKRVAERLEG